MSRADLQYIRTTLRGGINESPDSASLETCADALNVWCPRDRLESRPGYTGIMSLPIAITTAVLFGRTHRISTDAWTSPVAGILAIGSMDTDYDWYLGYSSRFSGASVATSAANTGLTFAAPEYYNGTEWKPLRVVEGGSPSSSMKYHLAATTLTFFAFAAPQDWASTTIDTQVGYWIRFRLNGAATSAATAVDLDNAVTGVNTSLNIRGMHVAQFPSNKRYHVTALDVTNTTLYELEFDPGMRSVESAAISVNARGYSDDEPSMAALVPQFNESFVSYSHLVALWTNENLTGFPVSLAAEYHAAVENRDFAIGPNAAYDKNFLAQLQSWPPSKYILFSNGRLWAANMVDDKHLVRWSAPAPYHKVWPSLSFEYLMEDDNSPITGLAVLGEQVVVFKQDSVWLMVNGGANAETGVTHYYPRKVVSGVGCVSNASVRQIRNRLVFLSEDGLYAFDGTPNIKKITVDQETGVDRLPLTVSTINRARRKFCAAAHWRKYRCYLLAVPTNGSVVNDKVIVWEYEKDRWWVWDNIEAQTWLEDEGAGDDERLLFGDSSGRLYEMGAGQTDDGGAISSYVLTQRFGYGQNATLRARAVNLLTSNKTRSLSVELTPDDGTATDAQTVDTTDYNEKDWGSLQWGATGADNWASERRSIQRADVATDGNWVQVKVSHSTKYQKMSLSQIELGLEPLGRR